MKRYTAALLLLLTLLTACGGKKALPAPGELFAKIEQTVDLPEMLDMTADHMEPVLGIEAGQYTQAVCYIPAASLAPEEIVIVLAKDEAAAKDIETKLQNRLSYKQKSTQLYLTEYRPMTEAGVVRRDGLTLSLIVSDRVEAIVALYDKELGA